MAQNIQREELAELKQQLENEKDAAYDLTVLNKELVNKLSLVRDGVPVSTFYTPGMDVIHEVKLQENLLLITKNVVFTDIKNHLIQDRVLNLGQVQIIEKNPTDQGQMLELILRFLKGPEAYYHFRNCLKESYRFVVTELDKFVVKREDIPAPTTTPSVGDPDGIPKQVQKITNDFRQQLAEKSAEIERLREKLVEQNQATQRIMQLEETLTEQKQAYKDSLNELEKRMSAELSARMGQGEQDAFLQMMRGDSMQQILHKLINDLKEGMTEKLDSLKTSIEDMRTDLQHSHKKHDQSDLGISTLQCGSVVPEAVSSLSVVVDLSLLKTAKSDISEKNACMHVEGGTILHLVFRY